MYQHPYSTDSSWFSSLNNADSQLSTFANFSPVGNAVNTLSVADHSIFYSSPDLHYCYPVSTDSSNFTSSYPSTPSSLAHESPCLTPLHTFHEYTQANAEQQQIYEEIVRECKEIERWSSSSSNASATSPYPSSDPESPFSLQQYSTWNPVKREKKKAQNRSAALRYREKKKLAKEMKLSEIAGLTQKNQELKTKVQEVSNEIAVLKKLVLELNVRFE